MSDSAIIIKNVSKSFGSFKAIDDISLDVKKGEIFGFLGPNGAGKTTTIKMLLNMIRPSKGECLVLGLNPLHKSLEINRRIGFLSGDMELYDNLTGAQYFEFLMNIKGSVDVNHLNQLISRLEATINQRIRTLSRGNKQKIGLIAALMHEPELLILDEPTSGLDPLIQEQFNALMREYKQKDKTVFISSHILSEVQQLCDRVGFMRQGKLVENVNVQELIQKGTKVVRLQFAAPTKDFHLPKKTSLLEKTSDFIAFEYQSNDPEIIDWLSHQSIKEVTIENSNLDAIFLRLYSKEVSK